LIKAITRRISSWSRRAKMTVDDDDDDERLIHEGAERRRNTLQSVQSEHSCSTLFWMTSSLTPVL
jgi:hypothetical protein